LARAIEDEVLAGQKFSEVSITHWSLESMPSIEHIGDSDVTYIVLEELQTSVLSNMRSEQFDGLKRLVSSASSILWVTGGDLTVGGNPLLAMAHGINTVLMNENSTRNLKFATLDVDDTSAAKAVDLAKIIAEVWTTVATAANRATCETDFMLKDGVIHISRVVPDMELNEEFTLDTGEGRAEQDFPISGNVQLALETPGLLDTVYFREKPTCDIVLGPDEVEIEVKAVGMNMKVC
jgi:hypothetical protein